MAVTAIAGSARAQSLTLTLGEAARLAARQAADPQVARLRAAQAEARVRQRRADFLPSIAVAALDNERTFNSASLGISIAPPGGQPFFDPAGERLGPVRNWDLRGTMRQTLLDPSAVARWRAAKAAASAGATDATGAEQAAAAVAATAYVRAARADGRLDARMNDSTLSEQLLEIARSQLAAGIGNALDVTRARSQAAAIRSQLIAARTERELARIDLARSLGLAADATVNLTDALPAPSALPALPTPAEAVAVATTRRADLRALAEQAVAAERQLSAIRAERLPALSLYADQGAAGKSTDRLLNTYTWGLQLSMPVFDGFRRESRLDEQRALAREIEARRDDAAARAAADVRTALVGLAGARAQLEIAAERLALAEQELGYARDRFTAGVAGNADVVTAAMTLNAARTQLVDARAALLGARVALGRAEGTLLELP